ncbi:hypothetical protein D5086_020428 [Populus alba]|uniref:Uncharacterized protein n=1 Tax=Populus alba TaxID=43335 RepID=A0ACC4BK13_POPAL
MMAGNGQLSVPPGFRFHPTDEELLYYYLRKKVSYEAIDLDVIREVDLNKLEPWDLKEKCRIGSGPQNEWKMAGLSVGFSRRRIKLELFSPESAVAPSFVSPLSLNNMDDIECSQNLLRLTSTGCGLVQPAGRFNGDWSFLDKLLASQQNLDHHQHYQNKGNSSSQIVDHVGASTQKFPFQYLGFETDILRFSK